MLRSTAVISLLFLISCPSAFAGDQPGFSIKVFTSPDDQFWVNSVIIEGKHQVMLVDAQLKKTSAEKALQKINETENTMLWIRGQRIPIYGDVLVNDMQFYTAKTDSKARGK